MFVSYVQLNQIKNMQEGVFFFIMHCVILINFLSIFIYGRVGKTAFGAITGLSSIVLFLIVNNMYSSENINCAKISLKNKQGSIVIMLFLLLCSVLLNLYIHS